MLVLGSPVCKWLLCLAIFMPGHDACSWLSSLWVLLYPALFYAFSWCLFLAYQKVSGYSALPYFMLAHDACFWPSRKWVPYHISCLTMMPLLGSPDCEWLCLAIFYASSCQFLALQTVSSCSLTIFYTSSCQFLSLQTVRGYGAFSYFMLMMPILDCSESEWLQCFPIIHA